MEKLILSTDEYDIYQYQSGNYYICSGKYKNSVSKLSKTKYMFEHLEYLEEKSVNLFGEMYY